MNLRLFQPDETEEPESDAGLIEAVADSDLELLRKRLAAGAWVDSRQERGHTVLMMAAAGGNVAIFQLLLDAGADPYLYIDLGGHNAKDDALAIACRFGQTAVVREWIDRGLDLAGTSSVDDPLVTAATNGHPEIAQLLIDAGADVNAEDSYGNTPLAWALVNEQHETADVLRKASGRWHSNCSLAKDIVADPNDVGSTPQLELPVSFHELAENDPEFQHLVRDLTETNSTKSSWQIDSCDELPGVWRIEAFGTNRHQGLHQVQLEIAAKGYHLIRDTIALPGNPVSLLLFPTGDKYAILQALETNGENYGISDRRVRAWLKELEREHPFLLLGAALDMVDGMFRGPIRSPAKLAQHMYEFCPDIVEQGCGSVTALADELQRTGRFVLWWD